MAGSMENGGVRRLDPRRLAVWAAAIALILLVPLLAMQVTDEVDWTAFDFVFAGVVLAGAGLAYELAAVRNGNVAYRAGMGVTIATVVFLIWATGAVGIIGTEDDPANLMYIGVLAVVIIGTIMARLRSDGMVRALVATALAQALVTAIAVMAGMGLPASPALEVLGANAVYVVLWLISAALFRNAAQEETSAGAGP